MSGSDPLFAVIDFDKAGAERRAERIRDRLDLIADNYTSVLPLIREAIEKRDDIALGYRSVGEYVSDRFGGALTRLGIEVRREVVRELTDAGLSTRAIAPIVGVHRDTVAEDIRGGGNPPPADPEPSGAVAPGEPIPTTSTLGTVDLDTGEVLDQPVTTETTETFKKKITVGIDGKAYPKAEPKADRRRSLVEDARNAGWQLRKAVERLERIHQDDRFAKNKVEILAALQPHLDFAHEVISDL